MARKAFDIEAEISEIAGLGREELVALWAKVHGCAPPRGVRQELLVRSAAWHLQARRLGGYSAETRRLLRSAIVEVGKRFADRTSASVYAERGGGKDSGGTVHRHEDGCSVDTPRLRDQHHAGTVEGEIILRSLCGSRHDRPMDHPPEPEQQTYQSLAVSWTAGERDQSIFPLLSSLATSTNSALIMAGVSRPPPAAAIRPPRQRRKLQPGARLLRDWNGKTHVVDVIEGGYVFEAKVYPSLTAIAGKITGVHWSGPRFFGL